MTDKPTPEQIKAFLDDLARLSLRHGVELSFECRPGVPAVYPMRETFGGYTSWVNDDGHRRIWGQQSVDLNLDYGSGESASIDLTKLSAHERIQIHAGPPPTGGSVVKTRTGTNSLEVILAELSPEDRQKVEEGALAIVRALKEEGRSNGK